MGGGGAPQLAGVPLLNITTVPQQVVGGNTKGVTLINQSSVAITLCTDAIPTASNSFQLPPNGASLPIAVGPLWAFATASTNLIVFPGILNVFNPNVLSLAPSTTILFPSGIIGQAAPNVGRFVSINQNVRTLLMYFSNSATTLTNVSVVGNQSGMIYYNQPPYLGAFVGGTQYHIVVPIMPGIDTDLTVTAQFAGGVGSTCSMVISGDTNEYDESVFYNGTVQVASASLAAVGTTVFLPGPARLLTLNLASSNTTGQGSIKKLVAGTNMLTSLNTSTPQQISFPDNTILDANSSLQLAFQSGAGTFVAGVSYAYP